MQTSSETALFTVRLAAGEYDRAEAALKAAHCYLAPTSTRGVHAVTCSAYYLPSDRMADKAAAALEHAQIMVYQDA